MNYFIMKAAKFLSLTNLEKGFHVLLDGIYISQKKFKNYDISLFRMDKNFVEIWYEKNGDIDRIEYLTGKEIIPYIKHLYNDQQN
jgi:hypothetical protein